MTTRDTGLKKGEITIVRELAAGVIAADSGTLTDVNIPPSAGVDCSRYDTLFLGVEIDAGSSPTIAIEILVRDELAANGSRWKKMLVGEEEGITAGAAAVESTGALDGTKFIEMRVFGMRKVFFRVSAVTNSGSTTGARILAFPGKLRAPS